MASSQLAPLSSRRGTPKSRSGCVRCRQRRQKCDEKEPSCTRCQKAGTTCDYAFRKLKWNTDTAPARRRLLPDSQASVQPPPLHQLPTIPGLRPAEALYLSRFRGRVLWSPTDRSQPAEFWSVTVTRESLRDSCICDCLIAIGALDLAIESRALEMKACSFGPIYKARQPHMSDWRRHFANATGAYGRALSALRMRIAAHASQNTALSDSADHGSSEMARTTLIASVLFIMFETIQGNSEGASQILTPLVQSFQKRLVGNLIGQRDAQAPRVAADDRGIHGCEISILREASFRLSVSPLSPAGPGFWAHNLRDVRMDQASLPIPSLTAAYGEAKSLWDKFWTFMGAWGAYAGQTFADIVRHEDFSSKRLHKLQMEQKSVQTYCNVWSEFTRYKLSRPKVEGELIEGSPASSSPTILWKTIQNAVEVSQIFVASVLDQNDMVWDQHASECEKMVDRISTLITSGDTQRPLCHNMPPSTDDYLLDNLHCITVMCRDRSVRQKGRALSKSLVARAVASNNWEVVTMIMRLEATCLAEEKWRSEDGLIPAHGRYSWVTGSWNEAHTELKTRHRRREHGTEEEIVMTVADFIPMTGTSASAGTAGSQLELTINTTEG